MSVLDDWCDLTQGSVRIETGEYTDEERRTLHQGSIVFTVGVITFALSGDYVAATFTMALAGVFSHFFITDT